jgi:hypothetical protein
MVTITYDPKKRKLVKKATNTLPKSSISYNPGGRQRIAGLYRENYKRYDDDDVSQYKIKRGVNKGKTAYKLKPRRVIRELPKRANGKRWQVYRQATPPPRNKLTQLVITVAFYKKGVTTTRKGYSTKRIAGSESVSGMFEEAFFSAKKKLGFSPSGYKILNHYFITWELN